MTTTLNDLCYIVRDFLGGPGEEYWQERMHDERIWAYYKDFRNVLANRVKLDGVSLTTSVAGIAGANTITLGQGDRRVDRVALLSGTTEGEPLKQVMYDALVRDGDNPEQDTGTPWAYWMEGDVVTSGSPPAPHPQTLLRLYPIPDAAWSVNVYGTGAPAIESPTFDADTSMLTAVCNLNIPDHFFSSAREHCLWGAMRGLEEFKTDQEMAQKQAAGMELLQAIRDYTSLLPYTSIRQKVHRRRY